MKTALAIWLACCAVLAQAPSVVAWGTNTSGECTVPPAPAGLAYVEIAAGGGLVYPIGGGGHTVARLSDGSVAAWGNNGSGQCNVPPLPVGLTYVEISAGLRHTVARRSDGSVVAWGSNAFGQCNVQPLPVGLTYVEIAAGDGFYYPTYLGNGFTVARRSDGSVVAWGGCFIYGQCNVPPLPVGLTYVEISAGLAHTVARRSDGSVVAWGNNGDGQCNVPPLPVGLTYVEVEAGWTHTVARRSDGSVVAWGSNSYGECNVLALPFGLAYVEIAANGQVTVARRSDGSVVAWGNNGSGQCNVPPLPAGLRYAEIAVGFLHTVARTELTPASVVSVGTGCGGAGMPVFTSTAPILGQNLTWALAQGTPNSSGFVFFSGIPVAPLFGFGCVFALDLAAFAAFIPVAADGVGAWAPPPFFLPLDPGLAGLRAAFQIALAPTAGVFGLDASNGLYLTLGY